MIATNLVEEIFHFRQAERSEALAGRITKIPLLLLVHGSLHVGAGFDDVRLSHQDGASRVQMSQRQQIDERFYSVGVQQTLDVAHIGHQLSQQIDKTVTLFVIATAVQQRHEVAGVWECSNHVLVAPVD